MVVYPLTERYFGQVSLKLKKKGEFCCASGSEEEEWAAGGELPGPGLEIGGVGMKGGRG